MCTFVSQFEILKISIMAKKYSVLVQGAKINFYSLKDNDFFSVTDIAKKFNKDNPSSLIINWLRNRDTIEFLSVWEKLHNPEFNLIEFDKIRKESGYNSFILSAKRWINSTNAIGIKSKSGRYGGTYAHKDITMAFCYWLSPPFQLYLIKEFQRLKEDEFRIRNLDWDLKRTLAKVNYRIHTDAIKSHLIPPRVKKTIEATLVYASEADLLNIALFGMTAKQWREQNPNIKGNIRDSATSEQLLVLANMENLNAEYIKESLPKEERLKRLNQIAIYQMGLLIELPSIKALGKGEKDKT